MAPDAAPMHAVAGLTLHADAAARASAAAPRLPCRPLRTFAGIRTGASSLDALI
jgi:hypothetical protein